MPSPCLQAPRGRLLACGEQGSGERVGVQEPLCALCTRLKGECPPMVCHPVGGAIGIAQGGRHGGRGQTIRMAKFSVSRTDHNEERLREASEAGLNCEACNMPVLHPDVCRGQEALARGAEGISALHAMWKVQHRQVIQTPELILHPCGGCSAQHCRRQGRAALLYVIHDSRRRRTPSATLPRWCSNP